MRWILLLIYTLLIYANGLSQLDDPSIPSDDIDQLISEARSDKNFKQLAYAYYVRANSNMGPGIKAREIVDDFNQSAIYYKFIKDTVNYHYARIGIARVHIENELFFDESIAICETALTFAEAENKKELKAYTYTILAKLYEAKQEYDMAIDMVSEAVKINSDVGNHRLQIDNLLSTSKLLLAKGEYEKLTALAEENLARFDSIALNDQQAEINYLLGRAYQGLDQPKKAVEYYNESIQLSQKGSMTTALNYKYLAEISEDQKAYKKSIAYRDQYQVIHDSINDSENQAMLNRIAASYKTKEQQRAIENLEQEQKYKQEQINQQKRLNYVLGFGAFGSLIGIFFLIRFYREKIKNNNLLTAQRTQIQKQELNEMENATKISNLKSMVYGQELERNRVAQDLHDSIGGMLSAIKLQFDLLHPHEDSDQSDTSSIHRIHGLIDTACEEVRKVSRNLKPSALENMGLEAAVRDLVIQYSNNPNMAISFHSNTGNVEIDYEMKLHLYRIIQELINNALKHARASELDIQIYANTERLNLTVEDNGKGFSPKATRSGLGLNNIQSRVSLINGELSIDSSETSGSSFFISIPLSRNAILSGDEILLEELALAGDK